jgi:hypothetical protein
VNRSFGLLCCLLAIGIMGCAARETRTLGGSRTPQNGKISKEELRDELGKFEDFFISSMKQTAEAMNAASPTQRMQRTNVQMQMRVVEALHAMSNPDDAIVAFLDTWGLVVRLRLYVEEGEGRTLYGQHQSVAVSFMKTAESEIERIGNLFLTPQQFDESKKGIVSFARQNPVGGNYANLVMYATKVQKEETGVLLSTLSIPMAPIRAMEGVDKTADAIGKFRTSADRFTNVLEQLPESSRWQMSILMDDFEESKMTQQLLKSLDDFTQSSSRLVEVLNAMPQQMRKEVTTALNESGQAQANLQTTAKTSAEAAIAIKNASDSIGKLVSMFQSDTPRDVNAPPPFGMRDFDTMLLNAGQTADKIAGAAAQLQQTSGTQSKIELQKQLSSLVDHIAWRLFQLLLAVFTLFMVCRYITKKITKKTN